MLALVLFICSNPFSLNLFLTQEEKMRKNIKRLSLALLTLTLSSPTFADVCNPFTVTVPNQNGGFSIGADALYLQPGVSYGSFDISPTSTTATTTNGRINSVDPNYMWGFDVMAAYRIPCSGNDVTVMWTHLEQGSDSATKAIPGVAFTDETSNGFGLPAGTYNVVDRGDLQFNYDAVDLDVGQRANFGDYFQFRTFAGVRWTELTADSSFRSAATATTLTDVGLSAASGVIQAEQNSRFDGVGPQIGIDGRYCLGRGFGIDANVTTSLLIGSVDSDAQNIATATTTVVGAAPTTATATLNLDADTQTRVVPAIDASLGLDYTYNFNNCDRSSLVIQAGWKVVNYFNVAQHIINVNGSSFIPPDSSSLARTSNNNVGFQGPYAGIKINM